MRTLTFLFISFVITSCSYRVTNNYNYYNCCPNQATWIDTVGMIGSYNVHAIGTRRDIDFLFKQTTITSIRGFKIVEIQGTDYHVEIKNPNF